MAKQQKLDESFSMKIGKWKELRILCEHFVIYNFEFLHLQFPEVIILSIIEVDEY